MEKARDQNNTSNEIILNRNSIITLIKNHNNIIEYVNDYFVHVTGYEIDEIISRCYDIFKHPDTPKIIYKELEKTLEKKGNAYVVINNLTKTGNYFWTIAYFEIQFDELKQIKSYYIRKKFIPLRVKEQIENLYKKLIAIEACDEKDITEKYFYGFLENIKMTYTEYILHLFNMNEIEISDYLKVKNIERKDTKYFKNVELGIIERALLQG